LKGGRERRTAREITEKAINDETFTLNPKDVTKEEALRIIMKAYE